MRAVTGAKPLQVHCASMKSRRYRRLIVVSRCSRCAPARSPNGPMTTSTTAQPHCSPHSILQRAKSSANATLGTGRTSSASSSTKSRPMCLPISMSTWSWTIMLPTKPRSSATGWSSGLAGMPTSRQLVPHESIRSNASSRYSPSARSGAASTAASMHSTTQSPATLKITIPTQNPSAGPNPPTISLHQSNASASKICQNELLVQDIRGRLLREFGLGSSRDVIR